MGGNTGHGSYQPGSMDISAHQATYRAFIKVATWGTGAVMLLMVLLAIFRTH